MRERLNYFTGKIEPINFPQDTTEKCEVCGTFLTIDCWRCGAPVCCPKCCDESANLKMEEKQ